MEMTPGPFRRSNVPRENFGVVGELRDGTRLFSSTEPCEGISRMSGSSALPARARVLSKVLSNACEFEFEFSSFGSPNGLLASICRSLGSLARWPSVCSTLARDLGCVACGVPPAPKLPLSLAIRSSAVGGGAGMGSETTASAAEGGVPGCTCRAMASAGVPGPPVFRAGWPSASELYSLRDMWTVSRGRTCALEPPASLRVTPGASDSEPISAGCSDSLGRYGGGTPATLSASATGVVPPLTPRCLFAEPPLARGGPRGGAGSGGGGTSGGSLMPTEGLAR
mmetsp:Transcript_12960/g.32895  ORF Transcript_12960/g.32895 Transcript_12960/m.32895 type:complete len:282 (+) Transcript_12960:156-1001(+)